LKIEALLHNLLLRGILRTPSKNLGQMSLFTLTDIPFFFAFQLDWIRLVKKLAIYQRNLQLHDWLSLSAIYPRIGMWTYVFCLFSWGEYCGQIENILRYPDNSIIAEVFLRHICQIDSYIDKFDSKNLWLIDVESIENSPNIRATWEEIRFHLRKSYITSDMQDDIFGSIEMYRQNALKAMQQWANSLDTYENILQVKYQTAGKLWYYWSCLLGKLYRASPSIIGDTNDIFFNFGMLVQIVDDLADTPVDYRVKTHNLFISIVKENPKEWDILQKKLTISNQQFLGWPWVREHLPLSYKAVLELYDHFKFLLLSDKNATSITKSLFNAVESIRRMST
jgi:hypothetical protein